MMPDLHADVLTVLDQCLRQGMGCLCVHPELGGLSEVRAQRDGRLRRHAAPLMNDLMKTRGGKIDIPRHTVDAQPDLPDLLTQQGTGCVVIRFVGTRTMLLLPSSRVVVGQLYRVWCNKAAEVGESAKQGRCEWLLPQ